jgi:hypothetical protein
MLYVYRQPRSLPELLAVAGVGAEKQGCAAMDSLEDISQGCKNFLVEVLSNRTTTQIINNHTFIIKPSMAFITLYTGGVWIL